MNCVSISFVFSCILCRVLSQTTTTIYVGAAGGTISSPGYPIAYSNNLDYRWNFIINTPFIANSTVTFTVVGYFQTEYSSSCTYDYLEVLSGSIKVNGVSNSAICGSYSSGTTFNICPTSLRSNFVLRFKSDSAVTNTGFSLAYSLTPTSSVSCSGIGVVDGGDATVGGAVGSSVSVITIIVIVVVVIRCCCCQPRRVIVAPAVDRGNINVVVQSNNSNNVNMAMPPPVVYPPQQMGYPPQQMGYPPQQMGYPPQQMGYPPQQMGYPPQQMGYPSQPAYPAAEPPKYTR